MEILQVLWERGPSTVREVHDELNAERGTGYTTTLKVMQVMHEKGWLDRDESERSHRYRPAVEQEETRRQVLESVIDRVFGGSAHQLVLSALGSAKASAAEMKKIRELLREARSTRKRKG